MPLTEPTVPTGMNIGVSICPWSVVITPHLAEELGSLCVLTNFIKINLTLKDSKFNLNYVSLLHIWVSGGISASGPWNSYITINDLIT